VKLLSPLKDVPPELSGVRNILVPPDIVSVRRQSPPRAKKRTPWHPTPDGEGTTARTGDREWFSDRLFVEHKEGHSRSSFTTSAVVHAGVLSAFVALFIARPEELIVMRASPVAMPIFLMPQPAPVAEPSAPSPSLQPPRAAVQVGAPSPTPPPPPVGDSTAAPAPVEAPTGIAPETGAESRVAGVEAGVAGGISGGVVGGTGLTASAPGPPGPAVVRVGSGMKPPRKIKDVKPVYPDSASLSRAHGTVLIEAVIGVDGKVQDVKVLVSVPLLDRAALDAVRQWEYEPPKLNGVAVAVIMTVVVNFALQ
jgi:protein TonB